MYWILKNKNSPCRIAKNSQGKPSETSVKSVFAKNKIISQGKKWKALLIVLFLVFSVNAFDMEAVKAETFNGVTVNTTTPGANTATTPGVNTTANSVNGKPQTATSTTAGTQVYQDKGSLDPTTGQMKKAAPNVDEGCTIGNFECYFKKLLIGVFNVCGWLFAIAATLFAWVIDPSSVSGANGVLNKQAVKDVWIMVRDLLNMTFILILLFAAFCTIFQVSKWNLKKVWLNILINALLVNFSFPIARFFIDVSNVAFYYLVNNMFSSTGTVTGNTIFAGLNASAKLGPLLAPETYSNYSVAYLIAMIIVVFLMGMTMMVVAALFVVRIVALAMLVMFSPVGFVGYIFPSTGGYADDWWKNLFSYSFFAPIMIFFMAVALRLTEALGRENFQTFISNANTNSDPNMAEWIASAAFYSIPVITMWIGIGVASSMKIKFANEVVKKVKEGGSWIANRPGAIGGWGWRKTGIPGGVKKGWENARKSGSILGFDNKFTQFALKDGREGREGGIASVMGKKRTDTFAAAYRKAGTKSHNTALEEDVKKAVENHDAETTAALRLDLAAGSVLHGAAMLPANRDKGVEYMSKYKQLMSDPIRKQEHEATVRQAALLTAAANPAVAAAHAAGDDVAKSAAIEAHVQQQIAATYGTMKTNYQAVKNVHKK